MSSSSSTCFGAFSPCKTDGCVGYVGCGVGCVVYVDGYVDCRIDRLAE